MEFCKNSMDGDLLFIALRFETSDVARDVLNR